MEWTSSEGGVKPEVRYFISSLDLSDGTPEEILAFVRHHWLIENCLLYGEGSVASRGQALFRESNPEIGGAIYVFVERAVSIAGLLKKGTEPLTAVTARVRASL